MYDRLILSLLLLVATTSHADTYNFYFKNPPKKKGAPANEATPPDMTVKDGSDAEVGEPTPVNPLTTPVDPEVQKREDKLRSSQNPPIIINNTNNIVGMPAPTPYSAPYSARQASLPSELDTMVSSPIRKMPSEYRFGIGPALLTEDLDQDPNAFFSSYYSFNDYHTRINTGETIGGNVSIGIVKPRGIAFNGFFGARKKHAGGMAFHGGVDLELMPVRSRHDDFALPFFEGGFLLGLSTLTASPGNWISGHAGLRFNFNFHETAGIAITGRGNFSYGMLEAAYITRL